MWLKELLARLKALGQEIDGLTTKKELSAEEVKSLNDKIAESLELEAQIVTAKAAEELRARNSAPAGAGQENADTPADQQRAEPTPAKKMTPEQKVGLIAGATLIAKANNIPALKVLSDAGYQDFAKDIGAEMRRKAIDTTAASVLIPEVLENEIIELLRPETIFFQGGPKRITFTHGKFKAPRGATGAVAGYVGEGQKKPTTQPTFDALDMRAKKLAAIVLITEEAKTWTLPNIDAYIRDDLRAAMSQAIDLNAFFGTGEGDSPVGIFNINGVRNYDASQFSNDPFNPTIAEIDRAASHLILSLTTANLSASQSWKWIFNYRTMEFLKNVRVGDDNTGVYAYPELRLPVPTWKGFGVLVSNQVPGEGGVDTDETMLGLVDFRHVLYGEESGLIIKTSDQATVDVNGELVHLWQQNMYGILTEHQHDFGLRHTRAATRITGVRWGATAFDLDGSPF